MAARQLGLFGGGDTLLRQPAPTRLQVGPHSWVDHQPGWLAGSDALFDALADEVPWRQFRRPMYERLVDEPRLVAWYGPDEPLPHPVLGELFEVLGDAYGVRFDSVGLNFYRNGRDSVAPHGDRVGRSGRHTVVAIVSVGSPRPFQLRAASGGPSRSWCLGGGDLLVMGGACQTECHHGVPKAARCGPRISVTYRCGSDDNPRSDWAEVPAVLR